MRTRIDSIRTNRIPAIDSECALKRWSLPFHISTYLCIGCVPGIGCVYKKVLLDLVVGMVGKIYIKKAGG
jgi:hypothetical protein